MVTCAHFQGPDALPHPAGPPHGESMNTCALGALLPPGTAALERRPSSGLRQPSSRTSRMNSGVTPGGAPPTPRWPLLPLSLHCVAARLATACATQCFNSMAKQQQTHARARAPMSSMNNLGTASPLDPSLPRHVRRLGVPHVPSQLAGFRDPGVSPHVCPHRQHAAGPLHPPLGPLSESASG